MSHQDEYISCSKEWQYISCSKEWLRDVIIGKIQFRKCPACDTDGVGITKYDENGEPAPSEYEGETMRYECDCCQGLAFLENPN